jgi:predicted kinase
MSLIKNAISLKIPIIYCDGYFITKSIRKPIIDLAKKVGYKVVIIWFNLPIDVCIKRKPNLEEKIILIDKIINKDPPDMNEEVNNIWIVNS